MDHADRRDLVYLAVFLAVLAWSAHRPHDYFTWFLEVAPALAGVAVVGLTRRRFPLSGLALAVILFHGLVLMAGGKYTYAENPLFAWISVAMGWERNYYDRLGHLIQGFTPALLVRELFLRLMVLRRARWLPFLAVCVALAISAVYEFIEWWVALASGEAAEAFLGAQGDVWDTQWDMFMALCGALLALTLFRGRHDRSLARLLTDRRLELK